MKNKICQEILSVVGDPLVAAHVVEIILNGLYEQGYDDKATHKDARVFVSELSYHLREGV
jgi:hypothetical protein